VRSKLGITRKHIVEFDAAVVAPLVFAYTPG